MAEHNDPDLNTPDEPDTDLPTVTPTTPEAHDEVVGVEEEGIDVRPLMTAALILFLAVVTAILVLFQWSNLEFQTAAAAATEQSGYPLLRDTDAEGVRQLTQYGVVGTDAYRIPIDRAIDLMVNEAYQAQGGAYSSELRLLPNQ